MERETPPWLRNPETINQLTPRERQVFLLLADGNSNQELADRLRVSERTIRAHLGQIMVKLEFRSRLCACLSSYVYQHHFGTGNTTNPTAAR
ncbi:response regulator transcription factor [Amycolatopsis sp. NPDC059021]|uniref:response regulator transcription factor n=1 Tax=Amycolatopsis sp. NPDC059021 TaxID=3346704 RepID=UPI00366AF0DB